MTKFTNFSRSTSSSSSDPVSYTHLTQGERIGQIFYWDHENEWDEEDYFDEFGVQMPEEVKFQNIYLIGKNLYDCFSRMIPV